MKTKWTYDDPDSTGESSFEEALDLFLGTSRIRERPGLPLAVSRRVRNAKVRRDRAVRATFCAAAAVALTGAVWFGLGAMTQENPIASQEDEGVQVVAEIQMLEESLYGAEALVDEDALDTLELLLGG